MNTSWEGTREILSKTFLVHSVKVFLMTGKVKGDSKNFAKETYPCDLKLIVVMRSIFIRMCYKFFWSKILKQLIYQFLSSLHNILSFILKRQMQPYFIKKLSPFKWEVLTQPSYSLTWLYQISSHFVHYIIFQGKKSITKRL